LLEPAKQLGCKAAGVGADVLQGRIRTWSEKPVEWLVRLLSRTTASGHFIPEVDGLRFIAIAAVVLHHVTASYLQNTERLGRVDLPAQWWDVFPKSAAIAVGYAGHFGVHLFFVISGFILALPFATRYRQGNPRPNLRAYYLRRLVRLEPPYVLNIILSMLLIACVNPDWRALGQHFWASLFYLSGTAFGHASWINGVAWSLEVEVQFYLVLPLLAVSFSVRSAVVRRLLLLTAVLLLAWLAQRLIHPDLYPRLQFSLFNYLHFFFAGFLLADLYQAHVVRGFRRRLWWDAVALLAAGLIFVILTRRYDLYHFTPLLIVALYIGIFLGRIGHFCIRQRLVVVIGGMCYTIYLYHFMVIDLMAPLTMGWASPDRPILTDLLLQCALLIPPILLVSGLLFTLVERPCMNLSRKLSRRLERNRPPAQAAPFPRATPD